MKSSGTQNIKLVQLLIVVIFVWGCAPIRPGQQVDNNQKRIAEAEKKVDKTTEGIDKNNAKRQDQTSTLAAGAQYSLSKVTNSSVEVDTAQKLTERILSIQGQPQLDELQKIKKTVDLLNSTLQEERVNGLKLLNERDKTIISLQKEKSELKDRYDQQMWDLAEKSKQVAKKADENLATINGMNSMFGLGAVIYGLKRFFVSCATGIIIFLALFLVLRILSMTNPVFAGIFSIFNLVGSAVIAMVRGLTPKAIELTGYVEKASSDALKESLTFVVDTVQKYKEKMVENPNATYTVKDLLADLNSEMDQKHKNVIDDILVEQKWKRR